MRRGGKSQVAVYTAVFGGYDRLIEQPDMPGVDLVCFTDDPGLRSDQWRVVRARARARHPRMAAKWFKTHPHRVLRRYRRTIWIDGGVKIEKKDFADIVLGAASSDGLSLFRHPVRNDIAAEAEFCVPIEKYAGLPMLEQVAHYRRRGFPDRSGLWAGGVIGREDNREIRRLGRAWWRENKRWTYQDQLSMPYLLWRFGIEPGVIPYGLWDDQLISLVPHRSLL
jgi:hypothetical protein